MAGPLVKNKGFNNFTITGFYMREHNFIQYLREGLESGTLAPPGVQARIVEMQPNLRDWLSPYARMTGAVVPVNARKKLDTIRKDAGLTRWPKNGLRHAQNLD